MQTNQHTINIKGKTMNPLNRIKNIRITSILIIAFSAFCATLHAQNTMTDQQVLEYAKQAWLQANQTQQLHVSLWQKA